MSNRDVLCVPLLTTQPAAPLSLDNHIEHSLSYPTAVPDERSHMLMLVASDRDTRRSLDLSDLS